MRHAFGSERYAATRDADRLVAPGEEAHLALQDDPRFVVGPVDVKRRHVSRWTEISTIDIWSPDACRVGLTSARLAKNQRGPTPDRSARTRPGVYWDGFLEITAESWEAVRVASSAAVRRIC